jgi:hypothetical protein
MYEEVSIWKRIDDRSAMRYRCWRSLTTGKWSVQSTDYYYLPPNATSEANLDRQLVELFIETDPVERSGEFDSMEEAIVEHDRAFDNW